MNGARCRAMNGLTYRKQTASEALNDGCIDCSDRVGGGGGGGGGGGKVNAIGFCHLGNPVWLCQGTQKSPPFATSICPTTPLMGKQARRISTHAQKTSVP